MSHRPWTAPHPAASPPPDDWLVAWDALLCQRLRHCLLCGAPCTGAAIWGIWDLSPQFHVVYIMHPACWQEGRATPAIRALLAARYGEELAARGGASLSR